LNGLLLAVGLQLEQRKRWVQHGAGVPLMVLGAGEEETEMDGNYVFLCGVMWCRFGQQDAGKELLRATNSVDPDIKALAWAMLAKGARRLRDLERPTPTGSPAILEETFVDNLVFTFGSLRDSGDGEIRNSGKTSLGR
jgi:hypothetical protein